MYLLIYLTPKQTIKKPTLETKQNKAKARIITYTTKDHVYTAVRTKYLTPCS